MTVTDELIFSIKSKIFDCVNDDNKLREQTVCVLAKELT
jgi:hypothetical protein